MSFVIVSAVVVQEVGRLAVLYGYYYRPIIVVTRHL